MSKSKSKEGREEKIKSTSAYPTPAPHPTRHVCCTYVIRTYNIRSDVRRPRGGKVGRKSGQRHYLLIHLFDKYDTCFFRLNKKKKSKRLLCTLLYSYCSCHPTMFSTSYSNHAERRKPVLLLFSH